MLKSAKQPYANVELLEKIITAKKQKEEFSVIKKGISQMLETTASPSPSERHGQLRTEASLPSLGRSIRIRTMTDEDSSSIKNYMKSTKTEKNHSNPQMVTDMIDMLIWYKKDRENK